MNDTPIAEFIPNGDELDTSIEQLADVDPADAAELAESIAFELGSALDPSAPSGGDAADDAAS